MREIRPGKRKTKPKRQVTSQPTSTLQLLPLPCGTELQAVRTHSHLPGCAAGSSMHFQQKMPAHSSVSCRTREGTWPGGTSSGPHGWHLSYHSGLFQSLVNSDSLVHIYCCFWRPVPVVPDGSTASEEDGQHCSWPHPSAEAGEASPQSTQKGKRLFFTTPWKPQGNCSPLPHHCAPGEATYTTPRLTKLHKFYWSIL